MRSRSLRSRARPRVAGRQALVDVVLGGCVVFLVAGAAPVHADDSVREHRVRYALSVRNQTDETVRAAKVLVEAPRPRTSMQEVISVGASLPFEQQTDLDGNVLLRFAVDLGPYARTTITVESVVAFRRTPALMELGDADAYTRPSRFVEADAPPIREAAVALGEGTATEIVRRALDWVADHVRMEGYLAQDRGALWALATRTGDCTESMDLFVALLRVRGIPARGAEGFVIGGDAVLRATAYHSWAEYYAGGTWHRADPQQRIAGPSELKYLTMRYLPAVGVAGAPRRYRFGSTDPALEVLMD